MQTQTFNIALPKLLVKRVDTLAKKEFRNRSELIREALFRYLNESSEWGRIFTLAGMFSQKADVQTEAQVEKIVSSYRHGRA